jgi:hypothetical protein
VVLAALCATLAGRTRGDSTCRKLSGDDLLRLRTSGACRRGEHRSMDCDLRAQASGVHVQARRSCPAGCFARQLADAEDTLRCAQAREWAPISHWHAWAGTGEVLVLFHSTPVNSEESEAALETWQQLTAPLAGFAETGAQSTRAHAHERARVRATQSPSSRPRLRADRCVDRQGSINCDDFPADCRALQVVAPSARARVLRSRSCVLCKRSSSRE